MCITYRYDAQYGAKICVLKAILFRNEAKVFSILGKSIILFRFFENTFALFADCCGAIRQLSFFSRKRPVFGTFPVAVGFFDFPAEPFVQAAVRGKIRACV